jgi:hypothetical protein
VRAAEWFEANWTGDRGNYMRAHAGVGGTNNNNGTEGHWGGLKKAIGGTEGRWGGLKEAIGGTSGSTAGLSLATVIPALMRYLTDVSKEQAWFWRASTKDRSKIPRRVCPPSQACRSR